MSGEIIPPFFNFSTFVAQWIGPPNSDNLFFTVRIFNMHTTVFGDHSNGNLTRMVKWYCYTVCTCSWTVICTLTFCVQISFLPWTILPPSGFAKAFQEDKFEIWAMLILRDPQTTSPNRIDGWVKSSINGLIYFNLFFCCNCCKPQQCSPLKKCKQTDKVLSYVKLCLCH